MPDTGNLKPDALRSDVLLVKKPEPVITYRTNGVVYEESLTYGQFVGRGWNGSGFIAIAVRSDLRETRFSIFNQ